MLETVCNYKPMAKKKCQHGLESGLWKTYPINNQKGILDRQRISVEITPQITLSVLGITTSKGVQSKDYFKWV
jgi:hypothetical protein